MHPLARPTVTEDSWDNKIKWTGWGLIVLGWSTYWFFGGITIAVALSLTAGAIVLNELQWSDR